MMLVICLGFKGLSWLFLFNELQFYQFAFCLPCFFLLVEYILKIGYLHIPFMGS